ncbi:dTMP kinase [Saccharothrix variisporea]|uniref:Thymidylate kinase n=1 Tax=Saccharothrix variisporea TaxID=543527 RepID=A0A495X5J5_9PSEU|nr:dTMP kinase [Saccharothrix variisporea]RKT69300.1 thymidylate kinase [Saccharothrix variisporea]
MNPRHNSRRGTLVVVVGLDGAGKTTQVEELGKWLGARAVPVEVLPNQSLAPVRAVLTEIAREDGFADHYDMLGVGTMRLISACAKLAYLSRLRRTLDTSDSVVVVDRYTYCQYAAARAQGAGNEEFLRRINAALPVPDLTIFLDVNPVEAHRRIEARGIDSESMEFLRAFQDAYRSLPEYRTFSVVDGNQSPDEVAQDMRQAVLRALPHLAGVPEVVGG